MSTRSAIDNLTISIEPATELLAGEPIRVVGGTEYLRLNLGRDIIVWIERGTAVRLIAAIAAASQMEMPDRTKVEVLAPTEPAVPEPAMEIPF